jgi:hypothetical protein
MTGPLETLLGIEKKYSQFPPNSRYYGLETLTLEGRDGKKIPYLPRRFIAAPEQFALLNEHTVLEGERIDTIAAQYLGDPEQFWRICDANRAMTPDELTEQPGRTLRITLPQGFPGTKND